MIRVSEHAVDRYIERIEMVDRETARRTIAAAERGIDAAVDFGSHLVRTPKAKLVLDVEPDGTPVVVTVFPRQWVENPHLGNADCAAWRLARSARGRRSRAQ